MQQKMKKELSGETETAASGTKKKRSQELNQATAVLWYPAIIVGNSANPAQCRKKKCIRTALGMKKKANRNLFTPPFSGCSNAHQCWNEFRRARQRASRKPRKHIQPLVLPWQQKATESKQTNKSEDDKPAGEREDLPRPEPEAEEAGPAETARPPKSVFLSRRLQRRVNVGPNDSSTALGRSSENAWGLASSSRNICENAVDAVSRRSLV